MRKPPQAGNPFRDFTKGPLPSVIGQYREMAAAVKAAISIPVIAVGRLLPELAEEMLAKSGVPDAMRRVVGAGSAAEGLHRLAEDEPAALLAVGVTHRGALGRIVPGSVGERLLHGAPCPIAVVPRISFSALLISGVIVTWFCSTRACCSRVRPVPSRSETADLTSCSLDLI